ncbi:hypothetical protein HYH03_009917 [Edaphochlamys debaryana]|uniref:Uncharacterized protein n=1 Tax=Edaphochlamys debaryana TaxID=47281 RepID=A0A836BWI7_9CHLO|nr:hypothetical protein HYH03_009917 [Edaphochlamys debaryana]|eukprot:KAG2491756.1 hypothetical protein HYH03_009917 [Edaphochlamys debaryana]
MAAMPVAGTAMSSPRELTYEGELDEAFSGLTGPDGLMTVAGFGSLLSERSARFTFPDLINFRPGRVHGWRRVFAHTADVFYKRGIARPETGEVSSLSLELLPPASASASATSAPPSSVVVSLFEVPATPASVAAFIAREHEFRFVGVDPTDLGGRPAGRRAVICARNTDADYRAMRCPPAEWARRWGAHGVERVWRDDVLPCRVYLRHCVLAARSLCAEAEESFLDATFLADRTTTIGQYLAANPDIMNEQPPAELAQRYNG